MESGTLSDPNDFLYQTIELLLSAKRLSVGH